ncbi:SDR family NAD(P)-dependent oxidoreductase [Streptomyces sp. RPA4-5]|uniref:SDR family NAD(P)-dependent oxidoreductase n=1 Tax=Streptomyces sp. RPA4-5 TaxID=2721245 RepID=UPI002001D943|nr:SDR family NAD(P)-dependent oxidoreductase [Streptomyces sp. RPA4-5]
MRREPVTTPLLAPSLTARPLQGRVALVTGAATGIGAATTRALASAGATVAIGHYAQIDQARTALDEVSRLGTDGIEVSADLTAPEDLGQITLQWPRRFGGSDRHGSRIFTRSARPGPWEPDDSGD